MKEAQDAKDKITKLHTKVVNLTEEAKAFKEEADDFANRAAKSKKGVEKLYSKVEDIFCKINPRDQICPVSKGKRGIEKLNNPLAGSEASRPTSFISQVINFFYPSIKQDEHKVK
ncbi:MAG: hypothetical protein ACR5KV_05305 [Wolbachia sp.]